MKSMMLGVAVLFAISMNAVAQVGPLGKITGRWSQLPALEFHRENPWNTALDVGSVVAVAPLSSTLTRVHLYTTSGMPAFVDLYFPTPARAANWLQPGSIEPTTARKMAQVFEAFRARRSAFRNLRLTGLYRSFSSAFYQVKPDSELSFEMAAPVMMDSSIRNYEREAGLKSIVMRESDSDYHFRMVGVSGSGNQRNYRALKTLIDIDLPGRNGQPVPVQFYGLGSSGAELLLADLLQHGWIAMPDDYPGTYTFERNTQNEWILIHAGTPYYLPNGTRR